VTGEISTEKSLYSIGRAWAGCTHEHGGIARVRFSDFPRLIRTIADYLGATRKASNPSSIHVELGIVNLHSSELNYLP
jgi:hypothetical protein